MKRRSRYLLLLLPLLAFSCRKDDDNTIVATDYSTNNHWLSNPTADKPVDVFYLYPTAWHKIDSTEPNICKIDNEIMLEGAATAYKRQASAFETSANIFAPYYRQADADYTLSLPESQRAEVIKGIPLHDAVAAFDYYIKHYNNGRPFILAGHSQGANVCIFLLSGYLKDHPEIYSRMIAAYVIGYPVTQQYLNENPHLKFAQGPDDTGVIISYNTQAPDVAPGANKVVASNIGLVINPISWTRSETVASAAENLGSLCPVPGETEYIRIMNYADAQVNISRGVLICSTANEDALMPITAAFGRGVYHSFDYPFYYYNIRQNAETRVQKYLSRK